MIGSQAKTTRNERLVSMRLKGIMWQEVADSFDLSVARAKEIFYREAKKRGLSIKVKIKRNKIGAGDNSD